MKKTNLGILIFMFSLLFSVGYAADVFYGELEDDLYYNNEVLLQGVELPSDLDSMQGTSSVDIEGTGTITVGDRTQRGELRLTVYGGTTIKSTRYWDADLLIKQWWEGMLPSPKNGQNPPNYDSVFFANPGVHVNNTLHVSATFDMGLNNEFFDFSPAARFVFPVTDADGTRLWLAFVDTDDDTAWEIDNDDFCIVKNGFCIVDITSIGAVSIVRELFSKCPPTLYSNGEVGATPLCSINCDRGYEINEDYTGCIESMVIEEAEEEESTGATYLSLEEEGGYDVRPGYFRYNDARGQLDRYVDTTNLTGEDKIRLDRQNAALLKTLGEEKMKYEGKGVIAEDSDGGFMNYLLHIRNTFGINSSTNDFSDEEIATANNEGEQLHASAPLLPSTGAGVFLSLAVLGMGLMIFSRRRN